MPVYTTTRIGFTPIATDDNMTLECNAAGEMARITAIGWGGSLTTSTGYRTRWVRPTTAGITPGGTLTAEDHSPNYSSPLALVSTTWATQPVIPGVPTALFAQAWNAHGGLGYVALPLANPWIVVNGVLTGGLSVRNDVGIDANGSSYQWTWQED